MTGNKTKLFIAIITVAFFSLANCNKAQENIPALNLRVYGVKLKVPDMDEAIDFYSNKIGFEIKSKGNYPIYVSLVTNDIELILEKTEIAKEVAYDKVSQTALTLQVNDLRKAIKRYKDKGIKFISKIEEVGVGIAVQFKDPFGNVHSLLEQQIVRDPEFKEPRIYNVGFYLNNIPEARKLYTKILNFPVRTEKYFPPALPLSNWDGSFGFMLHEGKELEICESNYFTDSQTIIMYGTDDVQMAFNYLKSEGIKILHTKPQDSPFGKYFAFLNDEDVPAEIVQPMD